MNISFDVIQTLGIAVIVFMYGSFIKSKVKFLQNYYIPAPVIGGLTFSLITFLLFNYNGLVLSFDKILQNFFMNIFFTCVGFTVSFKLLKKSGKQGALLAVIAVLFLVIQNIVGVSLASLFGINKLLGVAMGSISMSGGVGSGAAFGPTLESLGASGATTIGVAAATFGLLMGSMIGGPVAKRLIDKNNLKSEASEEEDTKNNAVIHELSEKKILNSILIILLGAGIGTIISSLLSLTGLTFPYYVGCLFGGTFVRNTADLKSFELHMKEINILGNSSLCLFLSLTLMSLNISKLVDLAIPMIIILIAQATTMMLYAYFITFKCMGRSYDAAVISAGHCGVGLGQTPNALANMSSVIEKNGPAPNAWFILPVITVVFINIFNPIIITVFINLVK